jgi:hypothetical protein
MMYLLWEKYSSGMDREISDGVISTMGEKRLWIE